MKLSDIQDAVTRAAAVGRQWPVYVTVADAQKLLDIAEAAWKVWYRSANPDDRTISTELFDLLTRALEGVEP